MAWRGALKRKYPQAMDLKTTMSGWRIWSKSWWAWSIKVEDGWKAQQLMSLVRTVMSFWRWVLMVRAWICLSSLREVQWGKRDTGGEVIVFVWQWGCAGKDLSSSHGDHVHVIIAYWLWLKGPYLQNQRGHWTSYLTAFTGIHLAPSLPCLRSTILIDIQIFAVYEHSRLFFFFWKCKYSHQIFTQFFLKITHISRI